MGSLLPYVISSGKFLFCFASFLELLAKGEFSAPAVVDLLAIVKNESFCLLKQTFRKKKYGWEKEKVSDLG